MDLKLENKVVLVTGGSQGIGLDIIHSFLAEGAHVANADQHIPKDQPLADRPATSKGKHLFIQADLCDLDACQNAVGETIGHYGQIDIIINNAGVNDGAGLGDGVEAFTNSLHRNLIHYYAVVESALDVLKTSRGVVINIGSKVSVTGQGGTSGYAAAKGGINALTREWAVDLAPFGIRVNAVLPSETWTPHYERWLDTMSNPQAVRKQIERLIPLGNRFTTSQEISDMVVFLASPRSSHTTGQIIFVDGGYVHLDRKCTADD